MKYKEAEAEWKKGATIGHMSVSLKGVMICFKGHYISTLAVDDADCTSEMLAFARDTGKYLKELGSLPDDDDGWKVTKAARKTK